MGYRYPEMIEDKILGNGFFHARNFSTRTDGDGNGHGKNLFNTGNGYNHMEYSRYYHSATGLGHGYLFGNCDGSGKNNINTYPINLLTTHI